MTATPRTIRAVLFDLDDTLHDDTNAQTVGARLVSEDVARLHPEVSAEKIAASYIAQADHFWKTIASDSLALVLSDVRSKMWARALADVGIADDGSLAQTCGRRYNEYRRDQLVVFPETLELLADLRARGVMIGMITNGLAETHREKIVLLKLESIFDLVFIADEVGYMKPDPEVFLLACERFGLPPEACAMVGDRYDRDMRTPVDLGMFTVWTNVRNELVPDFEPSPNANVPTLAGVAAALEPYLPARTRP